MGKVRWTPQCDVELTGLHAQGYSLDRIAVSMGFSRAKICERIRELGLPARKPGRRLEENRDPTPREWAIYNERMQGLSAKELAKKHKLSRRGLYHILDRVKTWVNSRAIKARAQSETL